MNAQSATRLVIAEDDQELRQIMARKFRLGGYEVIEISTGTMLADFLIVRDGIDEVDLIVSDIRMPGLSGLDMLAYLNSKGKTKPVVLVTGFGDWAVRREAEAFGALAVFDKPVDIDELVNFIRRCCPPRGPRTSTGAPAPEGEG
jgi:two-component system response regulator (stage 0 sporulation protein F)